MKQLAVVGSTGSIGTQTLEIARRNPDQYKVLALAARRSVDKMVAQAREFKVEAVALLDEEAASRAAEQLKGSGIEVLSGADGVDRVAAWPQTTMTVSALVGMAGLRPTLSALEQGIDVGLANKEALVVGGTLVTSKARQKKAALLPIDSEHSAHLPVPLRREVERRGEDHSDRLGWTFSQDPPGRSWPPSGLKTPSSIPPGTWAPRSPSTAPR